MTDHELVEFLQWSLPKIHMRWSGFRKVRRTIRKKLNRRLQELSLVDLRAYRKKLCDDPNEWNVLKEICRITISRFYRDTHVFVQLEKQLLPECADEAIKNKTDNIHVLSAGCASGEEPYTVSLIWNLLVGPKYPKVGIEIVAIDTDQIVLGRARRACYSEGSLKHLPDILVQKGFERANESYNLNRDFQSAVHFKHQDLEKFKPDRMFDIILCRNLAFTYFDASSQKVVLSNLTDALRQNGYLIIGAHETLPAQAHALKQIDKGVPIFQKEEQLRDLGQIQLS